MAANDGQCQRKQARAWVLSVLTPHQPACHHAGRRSESFIASPQTSSGWSLTPTHPGGLTIVTPVARWNP